MRPQCRLAINTPLPRRRNTDLKPIQVLKHLTLHTNHTNLIFLPHTRNLTYSGSHLFTVRMHNLRRHRRLVLMTPLTRDSQHMIHISTNSGTLPIHTRQLHRRPRTLHQRRLHTIMVRRSHTRMRRTTHNTRPILRRSRSMATLQRHRTNLMEVLILRTPVEQARSLPFRPLRLRHICQHHQAEKLLTLALIAMIRSTGIPNQGHSQGRHQSQSLTMIILA